MTPHDELLIDRYLADYDLSECHASVVNADTEATWQAIRVMDLSALPLVRGLLVLRSVPGRVRGLVGGHPAPPPPPFTFEDMPRVGFLLLDERPGEIVFGTVNKPWQVGDEQPRAIGRDAFAAFAEPGYTKIAFTIRAEAYGTLRTLVTTETRVATTDASSRRRFARYWRLVGPFSALIRRMLLSQLRSSLEPRAPGGRGAPGPTSAVERFRTRLEHELDSRSAPVGVWLLRRTKGRMAGPWHRQVLVLTTTGRRTGRSRVVPLQYFPDGDDLVLVAANSGMPSPPGWYFNLIAHPSAEVEVRGHRRPVRAAELSAEEAAAFWPRVLQAAPDYARYPRRTGRRIPLVRLVPSG